MTKLDINFKTIIPDIIDAYTSIYGEEYRSSIIEKLNNTILLEYQDPEELFWYLENIKKYKKRELSIKFLKALGIKEVDNYEENYSKSLPDNYEEVLSYYIGKSYTGFHTDKNYLDMWIPIRTFMSDNKLDNSITVYYKIKLINYLRNYKEPHITEENLEWFTTTYEYQLILNKINKLNQIYEELLSEYKNFIEEISPYEEYIKSERERKKQIIDKQKLLTYKTIYHKLPQAVIDIISTKTIEEQLEIVFGDNSFDERFRIENFSKDNFEILKSKDAFIYDKNYIIREQINYLSSLGIIIPIDKIRTDYEIDKYLEFINQNNLKKYLPTFKAIESIKRIKANDYEQALKKYYITRKDFLNIIKKFDQSQCNTDFVYEFLKINKICVGGGYQDNNFVTLLFYTIRRYDVGYLLFVLLHEVGHVLDKTVEVCGFDYTYESVEMNCYDNRFRKYERFNETLTDIFAIETLEVLHKNNQYFIEPKKYLAQDIFNYNTYLNTKNILYPLVKMFRKEIIESKMKKNPEIFIHRIGKDNFEELVDIVNKVDYLCRNDLTTKEEYQEQQERINKVYESISEYSQDNYQIPKQLRKIKC